MPLARRNARYLQQRLTIPFSHGQVTASNTPIVLAKTSASRTYRIDRVQYVNSAGLAANASNYFDVRILNNATIAAKWSTLTGSDGSLPANGEVDLTLQAAAALIIPAGGTSISLALVLTGTQTLPAGSGFIEVVVI